MSNFEDILDDGLEQHTATTELWPDDETPELGWDNADDIKAFKDILRTWTSAIQPGEKGEQSFYDLAWEARLQGVHPRTATHLIWKVTNAREDHTKLTVQAAVKRTYHTAGFPAAGIRSYAKRTLTKWHAADEDDSWLEGGNLTDVDVWPRPILYRAKENESKNAETFLEERPCKLISHAGQLYSLGPDRLWTAIEDDALAAEIFATDPSFDLGLSKIKRMVAAIHLARRTDALPFTWIDEPVSAPDPYDLIIFRNGLLDLVSGNLTPLTGQYFATGTPSFDYDPDADCPRWQEKLGEWLLPSFHPTLQEFMGYAMTPDTRYEVLLALIGAPRGGKGTISHVLRSLVGPEHHISRTLSDFGDSFGLEGCLDKRLIIVPDAADTEVSKRGTALERIKSITGNDEISINRKNLAIITMRLPAKLMIVANRHPKFLDESGALAARELVVTFDQSFIGREDRDLRTKLDAELPGIANWALDGLRRLRANGGRFTIGDHGRAAAREIAENQSPALRFTKACLIVTGDPEDYTATDQVYDVYRYWADEVEHLSGRELRNRDDFKLDLLSALAPRGVKHGQFRWHNPARPSRGVGRRRRGWFGIKLKVSQE